MVKDKRKLTYPLSTKRDYEEFVSYTANITQRRLTFYSLLA